ncbi:Serine protease, subtilisin family [Micromonospora phaseoli]|uniref:Serine protease, subtilisin family n=1 Tax=Micromonospora phaseoli TaxID=1144548 RepID=A0A1H7DGH6_9ACTN|nr:S8 family serine peptidase [Micromonospora phaseoli]PZW02296.1 subtilisin family serine protease [Micromonospora phaseoli]SEK00899.1 Serine protease, subtilisin family [Micromonospora phaseoli]
MFTRPSSRSPRWRAVAVLTAAVLGLTAQPAVAAPAAQPATHRATVDPQLLDQFGTASTATFLVYLAETAPLASAGKLPEPDARAREVHRLLTTTATRTQRDLRTMLDERKVPHTAYWIANALRVEGDKALVEEIAGRPEVARIVPSRSYPLVLPTAAETTRARAAAIEWGLTNIGAPQVWDEFGDRGEGVVVANIDSGVRYDHAALVGSYRGNLGGSFDHAYNWFDPAGVCAGVAPCDNNDHGTHTMGTMVGDDGAGNQIGVAPGAKWIAAKGCESNNCSDASLLAAGQWVLAPTDANGQNPRPDLRPDIVNNSWGGDGDDPWYQQTVAAWRAAGMFPVFSSGNDGPACGSAGSPGDNANAYAVGAYDVNNNIAGFSGRGSGTDLIKPNIAAPGSSVRSSVRNGGYASFSGTSMAAPHVAGAVALVWAAAPSLRGDIAGTEELLDRTARDVDATTCGGTPADNNVFGEGRLDAYAAVRDAPRGPVGRLTGVVTDAADGDPLAGATVTDGTRSASTGADGRYALSVPAGEATLTASAYGYAGQSATVTVPEDGTVTRDFALVETPTVTVKGKITDGSGHGWPLYAKVEVSGRPGDPVFTDPVTGRYSFAVPGNTSYQLTVTARYPGYRTVTREVAVGGGDTTANVAVPVDAACSAAGYTGQFGTPLLTQSFDGTSAPPGWTVTNRTTSGGWVFNDLRSRGNLTGGSGGFAIIDSDALGSGNTQDTDLVAPPLDLSGAAAPVLRFRSDWRAVGITDTADIDVSTDAGATWTNVWHQTASRRGPRVEEVPLTPAANASSALVRFRFKGTFAWWWQVDDVEVVNRDCSPVPGGLVVGTTTDRNTDTPLNGVTVVSDDRPADRAVSAATPEDPAEPDGFYWLFSGLTGAHPFTASRTPYQPATKDVAVAADGVKRANFALGAGRLTVSPTTIESHQPYGSTRTTRVTVRNSGTAPATVDLLERSGQFELLKQDGAPLREQKMKGISKERTGIAYGGAAADAAIAADDAWAQIARLPASIYDNAAAWLDGKVYSVGGGGSTGNERKAWAYDPDADAWTALPDLPTVRSKPTAAAIDGKLYVIGGWSSSGTNATVDVFDPAAGTWSTLPGVTNPTPVAAAGAAVLGGKVYLVGGCADSTCTDTDRLVVFDAATGAFSTGAAYPHPVSWLSCGGIGAAVYCAGGLGSTEYTDAYRYDPASDSWSPLPAMPLDLWGSQYTAAGGLLVLAGGVTAGSTAVTNRTIGFDPATGAWRDLPNAQFGRYRGAAACGAYKIGGSPSSFVGSAESERLGGLGLCAAEADLPWLGSSPTTFTLAPGASRTVTVTLTATAAAGVVQPGRYAGELAIASDSPYPVTPVSVEMNVSPPANWGKIQGTVTGTTCGGVTVGIPAIVRVNLISAGTGTTLTAEANGRYAWWLPKGRYEVIVAKDGWVPQVRRHQIEAGIVGTLDFALDPISTCTRATGI